MSGFGTLTMWVCGSRFGSLITIKTLITHLLSKVRRQLFSQPYSIDIYFNMWGVVCPSPENMATWLFLRGYLPVIINFYMVLTKIVLLV